jgi:quercetin dioxygenase-like cupin family protein
MDPIERKSMLVVEPGEAGAGATPAPLKVLCRSGWTDDRVFVLEQLVAPGVLVPAHKHSEETQGAYVVEGEITFWSEGEQVTVGRGGYVVRPAGALHSVWNATEEAARMIEITSPAARFERFVGELDTLLRRSDRNPTDVIALALEHGTEFDMDITQELGDANGVSTEGSPYASR